jgi:hypothetical protein
MDHNLPEGDATFEGEAGEGLAVLTHKIDEFSLHTTAHSTMGRDVAADSLQV